MSKKITKGKWVVAKHEQPSQWYGNITAELGKVDGIMNIRTIACLTKYCKEDEQEANAALIAEAGTVHNETGCTPRQLAEQKKALLDACKELLVMLTWTGSRMSQEPAARKRAKKAIASATN